MTNPHDKHTLANPASKKARERCGRRGSKQQLSQMAASYSGRFPKRRRKKAS